MTPAEQIAQLVAEAKGFIFDLDGTLYLGDRCPTSLTINESPLRIRNSRSTLARLPVAW